MGFGKDNRRHCNAPRTLDWIAGSLHAARSTDSFICRCHFLFHCPAKEGMHKASCPTGVKNLVNPQYKCGKVENVQVARFVKLDVGYISVCEGGH